MQVSNSTGQSTDYRVGASSGAGVHGYVSGQSISNESPQENPGELNLTLSSSGRLQPGSSASCNPSGSFKVEFMVAGSVVCWESFDCDPGQVVLVLRDGCYSIEVQNAVTA